MRRTFADKLRRSGGRYPPIPASDGPPGLALSSAQAGGMLWHQWDAEAGPVDW